jgi:hypothetical protein
MRPFGKDKVSLSLPELRQLPERLHRNCEKPRREMILPPGSSIHAVRHPSFAKRAIAQATCLHAHEDFGDISENDMPSFISRRMNS